MPWWGWAIIVIVGLFVLLTVVGHFLGKHVEANRPRADEAFGRVVAPDIAAAQNHYANVVRAYEAGQMSSDDLMHELDKMTERIQALYALAKKYGARDYESAVFAMWELQRLQEGLGKMVMQREHEEWEEREGL